MTAPVHPAGSRRLGLEIVDGHPQRTLPTVEIVVPVHNEEGDLAASVRRLDGYLDTQFPYECLITIADNASTDDTWEIAQRLTEESPRVRAIHLDRKGRGLALKEVWSHSSASVVAYMDVDLSTDLRALLPLVAPLITGHSDLAIGTRLARSSRVVRGPKRTFLSRSYNLLLRGTLAVSFSDAQCGFKAVRSDAAARLLPLIENTNWFFDTELLVLAQRSGLRIHEVPVDWVDDPDSRVNVVATAREDLAGIARLARGLVTGRLPIQRLRAELATRADLPSVLPGVPRRLSGQLLRFVGVGVLSTLAYLLLYLGLRTIAPAQAANFAALLITAVANTATNRRITFGITGRGQMIKHQLGGLTAFGVGLLLTSGSLALLHLLSPTPVRAIELMVLVVANAVSTLVRFVALRQLMDRPPPVHRTLVPDRVEPVAPAVLPGP